MSLDVLQFDLKKKCIRIMKNNDDIETAVKKISNLKYENKNLGIKKAKSICKLFVYNSVSGLGKPDSFNHKLEVNNKMKYLNS
jgi:hypothetical protein